MGCPLFLISAFFTTNRFIPHNTNSDMNGVSICDRVLFLIQEYERCSILCKRTVFWIDEEKGLRLIDVSYL